MKKRGPRQGYIELLEKRLDKMEQLLQHGPSAVDPELLDSKSILNSRLRPGQRRASTPPEVDYRGSSSRQDPDERYFGTTSGYTSQYAEYEKQRDQSKGAMVSKFSSQSTLPIKEGSKKPLYGIKDDVPRKEILDHLIELFFDSIYYQLPIIHPGTFMKQYKEGKVSPNLLNAMCAAVARFSSHPDVVTTPAFLAGEPFATNLRGMLVDSIDIPTVSNVQALLFLSMYEYGAARGPRAWMFGGMAVRQAQELGLNREDSSPVFYLKGDWVMRETRRRTFWACFIMDVLASSSSGRPRMMDERDCEVLLPSEDHDWYDERPVVTEMLEEEQDSSSGTEHEPSAPRKTAETQSELTTTVDESLLPTEKTFPTSSEPAATQPADVYSSKDSNDGTSTPSKSKKQDSGHVLSSFAYLIRIVAVLGKVSQYVNRPRSKKAIPPNERGSEFSVIDAALTAWHKSIPPHLAYSLENGKMVKDKGEGCIIVFMHVVYHTSVVLLHRPILAADKAAFPIDSNFVENSAARCADAASKVSDVLEFVQAYNCPPRIFISAFFAYPVFTTATIHITNAFASDPVVASRARRSLSIHVKILQTMKSYWSMADKFFYIIRDLYSIQSKISSTAASSKSSASKSTSTVPPKSEVVDERVKSSQEPRIASEQPFKAQDPSSEAEGQADGKGKLASISSFLKSDSGLIALWRRATEMQVLDEAKQEKRRLSMTDDSTKRLETLEEKKELHPQDKALQEHRERMNALEIQEINQEFDRRWRSKVEASASTLSSKADAAVQGGNKELDEIMQESTSPEKRHKDDEALNPRASKLAKVAKGSKTKAAGKKTQGQDRHPDTGDNQVSGANEQRTRSMTYRHSLVPQPQELRQHESYMLQPMQIQPVAGPTVTAPASSTTSASNAEELNRHLIEIYAQQHQQQESLSKSIDMMQNAAIQRQQQQLQLQQQQAAQMSSLAFGPPSDFSSSFLTPPLMQGQPGFSQQNMTTESMFGLPLVYGSNYGDSQAQRLHTESLGSLFDFALPQEDISFLSNSFQVTPIMLQENTRFANGQAAGVRTGAAAGPGSTNEELGSQAATGSSPANSATSSTPQNRPTDLQSPSSDPSQLFNISPGLPAFLSSADEASFTGAQATPTNLIRYLQLHHQQELQQQELQQQQDMQPLTR
ncbi:hypothetical protein BGX28_010240 [Mortierella sp. GBA30]|nr:hypothetical protein BGX28_010240 [Mortierella sp. GBA30]